MQSTRRIKQATEPEFNVIEVFDSIDGEGVYAGHLATFFRFAGCNLRCSYCDTKYAYDTPDYHTVPMSQMVKLAKHEHVTLTGGEPLIQPYIYELIARLTADGHIVNVETNGAVQIPNYGPTGRVLFTMDWKCPSSGMNDRMIEDNLYKLTGHALKCVVGTDEDLHEALRVYRILDSHGCLSSHDVADTAFYLSPVFGQIEPAKIVQFMKDHDMEYACLNMQLHKLVWDPQKRGV